MQNLPHPLPCALMDLDNNDCRMHLRTTRKPTMKALLAVSKPIIASESEDEDPKPRTKRRRSRKMPVQPRRLPEDALAIIREFCDNVSINPGVEERALLLSRVRAVRGAGWYTARNLRDVFRGRRDTKARRLLKDISAPHPIPIKQFLNSPDASESQTALKEKPRRLGVAGGTVLWPSLLEGDKLPKLAVLQAENPMPDEIALQVWSRALKAEKKDIENWLRVHPRLQESQADIEATDSPEPTINSDDDLATSYFPLTPPCEEMSVISDDAYTTTASTFIESDASASDAALKQVLNEMSGSPVQNFMSMSSISTNQADCAGSASSSAQSPIHQSHEQPDAPSASLPQSQISDTMWRRMKNVAEYVQDRLDSSTQDIELRPGSLPGMSLEELGERMQASVSFYERIASGAYASLGLHASYIGND